MAQQPQQYGQPGAPPPQYGRLLTHYTPGIYAEGYIVFVFPFVCSFVCSFVRSYFLPSRGICVKVLR